MMKKDGLQKLHWRSVPQKKKVSATFFDWFIVATRNETTEKQHTGRPRTFLNRLALFQTPYHVLNVLVSSKLRYLLMNRVIFTVLTFSFK